MRQAAEDVRYKKDAVQRELVYLHRGSYASYGEKTMVENCSTAMLNKNFFTSYPYPNWLMRLGGEQ